MSLKECVENSSRRSGRWVWAVLAAVLALYIFSALRADPIATFGTSGDDALYFSSGKALAAGEGYILPGFPERLRATKYPELYPLLLAGIWKVDPLFPNNVKLAVGLSLAFGCAALIFAFLLLRSWPGMDDWQALGIVVLCGFTYYFLRLSYEVGTEIPFTALLLGSAWLAEHREWGGRGALATGILAGLSVGLRSLGVTTIAGIGLFMLVKRDFKRLTWFLLSATPLALVWLWPALAAAFHPALGSTTSKLTSSGWTQTLCYYSSYACNWRMNISGPGALSAVISKNLKEVVQEPGFFLLDPLATRSGIWSLVVVMLVSAASYVGIIRHTRQDGWHPLFLVYLLCLLVIVPWPYTPERFLASFLPLFFGGLWLEARHIVSLAREHLRSTHSASERITASLLAAGVLALAVTVAVNYADAVPSLVATEASKNQKLLADETGAYAWISQHAPLDANVVAYEDGLLFLYTKRRSVVPIAWDTLGFYDGSAQYAKDDADHLANVARQIRADGWLVTKADFDLTDGIDRRILREREKQLLARAPILYRSADGAVALYDVRRLWSRHAHASEPPN